MTTHIFHEGTYVIVHKSSFLGVPSITIRVEKIGAEGEFSGAWNDGVFNANERAAALDFARQKCREYDGRLFVEIDVDSDSQPIAQYL